MTRERLLSVATVSDLQRRRRGVTRVLQDLKVGLERLYGARLQGVYLYGSYVRGEADDESDIDVLVVLDDVRRYGEEVERTGSLVADLARAQQISICPVFITKSDWTTRERQRP